MVPHSSVGVGYAATVCPIVAGGGGFVLPKLTSYAVAPGAFHVSVGDVPTPAAPSTGAGELAAAGGCGVAGATVKGHLALDPLLPGGDRRMSNGAYVTRSSTCSSLTQTRRAGVM